MKREPEPLTFPLNYLKPAPTAEITYSCNLPSPFRPGAPFLSGAFLDDEGVVPHKVAPHAEAEFLHGSLPGGQIEIFHRGPGRRILKFRWLCISADYAVGALWRCYARLRDGSKQFSWEAIGSDYFFDAGENLSFHPPALDLVLDPDLGIKLRLVHPSGRLTQFLCSSGRVKVTHLSGDGWAKRSLQDIRLFPGGDVTAYFSDGKALRIGIAAVSQTSLAHAA